MGLIVTLPSQTHTCHQNLNISQKTTEKSKNKNSNKNYQPHYNNNNTTQQSILKFLSTSVPISTTNQNHHSSKVQNKPHCSVNHQNGNPTTHQLLLDSYTSVTTNKLRVNERNPLRSTTALNSKAPECNKT